MEMGRMVPLYLPGSPCPQGQPLAQRGLVRAPGLLQNPAASAPFWHGEVWSQVSVYLLKVLFIYLKAAEAVTEPWRHCATSQLCSVMACFPQQGVFFHLHLPLSLITCLHPSPAGSWHSWLHGQ